MSDPVTVTGMVVSVVGAVGAVAGAGVPFAAGIGIALTVVELMTLTNNIKTLIDDFCDNPESLEIMKHRIENVTSILKASDNFLKNSALPIQTASCTSAIDPAKWTEFIANVNTLLEEVKAFIEENFTEREGRFAEGFRKFLRFTFSDDDKGTIDGFCVKLSVVIQAASFMLIHEGHVEARTLAESLLGEVKSRFDRSESKAREYVNDLLAVLTTDKAERMDTMEQLKQNIDELAPVIISSFRQIESKIDTNDVKMEQGLQSTTMAGLASSSASSIQSEFDDINRSNEVQNLIEQYTDILTQLAGRSPKFERSKIDTNKVQYDSKNDPVLLDFGDWTISVCKYNNRTRWMKQGKKKATAITLLTKIEARIHFEICQLAKSQSYYFPAIHQFVAYGVVSSIPIIIFEKAICRLTSALTNQSIRDKLHQISRKQLLNNFLAVCDAVAFLHRNSYLHQNINTTNILIVSSDWEMKLSGFQYACRSTDESLPVPGKELFLNHEHDILAMTGILYDLVNLDLFENDISEEEKAEIEQISIGLDKTNFDAMKNLSNQLKPILQLPIIESKTDDAIIEEKVEEVIDNSDNSAVMERYTREFENGWTVEALISKYLFEAAVYLRNVNLQESKSESIFLNVEDLRLCLCEDDKYSLETTSLIPVIKFITQRNEVDVDIKIRWLDEIKICLQFYYGIADIGIDHDRSVIMFRLSSRVWELRRQQTQPKLREFRRTDIMGVVQKLFDDPIKEIVVPLLWKLAVDKLKKISELPNIGDILNDKELFMKEFWRHSLQEPDWSIMTSCESGECVADFKCDFHSLPRHMTIASLFIGKKISGAEIDFDSLSSLVENCCFFGSYVCELVFEIRDCKNGKYFNLYDGNFIEAYSSIEKLIELETDEKAKLNYKESLSECRQCFTTFFPAKNVADDFDKNESRLKILTAEQWKCMKPLIDATGPCKLMLEAPAGCGKTLFAIKLTANRLISGAYKYKKILLLSHSRPLVRSALIPGIEEELKLNGLFLNAQYRKEFWSRLNQNNLFVMTIDELVKGIFQGNYGNCSHDQLVDKLNACQAQLSHPKYDMIIIDEGQHVFSRQADPSLEGQHLIPKGTVREVIDSILTRTSQLIIFHDPYQKYEEPAYPIDCEVKVFDLKIIRSPGHVRDASVPFYTPINESEYHETSLKFVPIQERSVRGPRVMSYVCYDESEYGKKIDQCLNELVLKYGKRIDQSSIAILFSSNLGFASLKASVVNHSTTKFVNKMLKESNSDAGRATGMYLGRMENFAGLERSFIIVVGNMYSFSYSAITRCTFQLCLIGMYPPALYDICETDIGEEVNHSGKVDRPIMLLNDREVLRQITVDLDCPLEKELVKQAMAIKIVKLSSGLISNSQFSLRHCLKLRVLDFSSCFDVATSAEERINDLSYMIEGCRSLTRLNISNNQLKRLPDGIRTLSLLECLDCSSNDITDLSGFEEYFNSNINLSHMFFDNNPNLSVSSLDVLKREGRIIISGDYGTNELKCRIVIVDILKHTRGVLSWNGPDDKGNRFNWSGELSLSEWDGIAPSVTPSSKRVQIGENGMIVKLFLNYLGMEGTLPPSIGNLTSLTHLYVGNNKLTNIPDSIGNLVSLTYLDISNNQLIHIPDWIGNLKSLAVLDISNNQLSHIPDWIGNLKSLAVLDISNNQLSHIPDSIGSLTSLTVLNVRYNPITSTQEGKDDVKRRFGKSGLSIWVR